MNYMFLGVLLTHSLADTNIANLSFIHHFFQFLPRGVDVHGQLFVDLIVSALLEGYRPVCVSFLSSIVWGFVRTTYQWIKYRSR